MSVIRPAGATPAPAAAATLWDALEPEERAFFERLGALGPLTYGPRSNDSGALAPPTGRRIDVRA